MVLVRITQAFSIKNQSFKISQTPINLEKIKLLPVESTILNCLLGKSQIYPEIGLAAIMAAPHHSKTISDLKPQIPVITLSAVLLLFISSSYSRKVMCKPWLTIKVS